MTSRVQDEVTPPEHDPFAGAPIARLAPTTDEQREILAAAALGDEANCAYNEAVVVTLRGPVDASRTERALRTVAARHDALRTTFSSDLDELCVSDADDLRLEQIELPQSSVEGRRAAAAEWVSVQLETPMSLTHGPLFRAFWLQLDAESAQLMLLAHHAVCDGWSFHVVLEELQRVFADGDGSGLPPAPSFADYAEALRDGAKSAKSEESAAWWRERLRGAAEAPLALPTDRPRPPVRGFLADNAAHRLDASVVAKIELIASRTRSSSVSVVLAAVAALLHRITDCPEVTLGMPVARQGIEDRPGLVGHCVQLLPIRLAVDGASPLTRLVTDARTALLDATEHYDFGFGQLVRELGLSGDPSRVPLTPVVVNVDQPLAELRLGEVKGVVRGVPRTADAFEVFLNVAPDNEGMMLDATFQRALFDRATIAAWLQSLERLIVAAAAQLTDPVASLQLCDDSGRAPAGDAAELPASSTWLEHLGAWADRAAERTAVEGDGAPLTYAELARRARALAATLVRSGVQRGDVVAVATARRPELLVSIAGVHLAGAAHLPLDPSFPSARLRFMLEDSGAVGIVDGGNLPDEALIGDLLAFESADSAAPGATEELPRVEPGQLAYLIYTSGSTGKPKGVKVPHSALANLLDSIAYRPGLTPADRLLAVTTISFDISLLELLAPLVAGGCVVIATQAEAEDPVAIDRLLRDQAITVMQSTPATWRMLVELGWSGKSTLRAFCGGERLPEDLAAELLPRVGSLWNLYGPTETTIWSTVAEVAEAATAARVGEPVQATRILILDKAGNELPAGFPGEICIAGAGVALGYHNRAQLTAERFVDHLVHGRYYRTGDRGRLRPDGALECLGRSDHQVKLRGFRIELGEIEAALAAHPEVHEAAVVVTGDSAHERRLVAHVATADAVAPVDLDDHLKARLPRYMVPHVVMPAGSLPRLPNGKLDRRALLERVATQRTPTRAGDASEEVSEEAHVVGQMMARTLGLDAFGPDLDFFAAGGHSLLVAKLVTELNRSLSTGLTMRDVFESPTPRALGSIVGAARSQKIAATAVTRRPDQTRAPVTKVQERIWHMQQMLKDQAHYNLPSGHRLRGELDVDALRRALREVVHRHAALRTVFERKDGEVQMVVHPTVPEVVLGFEDLSTAPESARGALLGQQLKAAIARPFDLAAGPLFVARLYRLSQEDHLLFFMPHHIIWDGWSFDVFYEEMAAVYAAYSEGREHQLPSLPYSYGDFTSWHVAMQQTSEVRAETGSWRARLEAFGAVSPLPTDRERTAAMSGSGATEWIALATDQTQALHEVASAHGATMYHVLLATYCALLYEYGDRERLLIATPLRGREAPGSEDLMGCCNSLLPLPLTVSPDAPFTDLLAQVRETAAAGLAHSNVLLEDVALRRSDRRTTLYHALFSFQDARLRVRRWGNLHHEPVHLFQEAATEDLGLWFLEGVDGLFGGLTYNRDVLDKQTIEQLRGRMLEMLELVAADPSRPVTSLCRARSDAGSADGAGEADASSPAGSELRDLPDAAGHSAYLLAAIWRRMLEVPSVGLRDDFFELGGDSLMAIRSIAEFEEATGTRIDLGAFMRTPTIAGVSAHVAAGAHETTSAIVPLQHLGEGAPIYCLLGVGIYRHFAVALGPHQPVYGVYTAEENVLSGGVEAIRDGAINRLASAYVEILKRDLKEPRLQLAGLSMGGIIALEVARRMAAQGYSVERVVLFDTILPSGYRKDWWAYLRGTPAALLQRLLSKRSAPASATQNQQLQPAADQQRTFRELILRELPTWSRKFRVPTIPVHLCRATDTSSWGRQMQFDPDYGWAQILGEHLEVVLTEGDHLSLLRPPNVEELAAALRVQMGLPR